MDKFFFPYEYLNCVERLYDTSLPPYPSPAWYSSLKEVDLLEEEYENWDKGGRKGEKSLTGVENYAIICNMWEQKGWKTMSDLLTYYNDMDCLILSKR